MFLEVGGGVRMWEAARDSKLVQSNPWWAQNNRAELVVEQKWPQGQCMKQSGSFKVLKQGLDSFYWMLDEPPTSSITCSEEESPFGNWLRSKIASSIAQQLSQRTKSFQSRRFLSHGQDAKLSSEVVCRTQKKYGLLGRTQRRIRTPLWRAFVTIYFYSQRCCFFRALASHKELEQNWFQRMPLMDQGQRSPPFLLTIQRVGRQFCVSLPLR